MSNTMDMDNLTSQPSRHIRVIDRVTICPACLQRIEMNDVLIIGVGAAGLAVALSILKKARDGWPIDSLVMVDKSEEPGVGFAYSIAADGTTLNRLDEAMSLIYGQPYHFLNWAEKGRGAGEDRDGYTEREKYGNYLKEMVQEVTRIAWGLKVDFRLVRKEAVDLERHGDEDTTHHRVILEDGCSLYAKKVVLALGNFPAVKEGQLIHTPGYFPSPWPTKKFKGIPQNATIGIVGTSASAIDVVTILYQQEHRGKIYMMSRSGRLPRVEGASRPFLEANILHTLVRGLEAGEMSLEDTLDNVRDTILRYEDADIHFTDTATPETGHTDRVYGILIGDLAQIAREGFQPRHILEALRPIAQRIWHFAKLVEGVPLLEDHLAWKLIRQETMSVNHALVLESLISRGQLKVLRDDGVELNGDRNFMMGRNNKVCVDYLVEATGLEHDIGIIASKSTILRRMIRKGLVEPDHLGGVEVRFPDLRAGPNIYAIGSLTKGAHHFVQNVSRIACHASRISDGLVGLPPSQPIQIGLFVNRDLFSLVIMMKLVPELLLMGHMPFVFLLDLPDDSLYLPDDERGYYYFESVIVPQVIIPDYKSHGGLPEVALMMTFVENEYGVRVEETGDINDPNLLRNMRNNHIDIGIIIGSGTEPQGEIRDVCPLYQLKPGLGPLYLGIRQVINQGGKRFGYSLESWSTKTGEDRLISMKDRSIARAPCACSAMLDTCKLGVELLVETVSKFSRGLPLFSASRDFNTPADKITEADCGGSSKLVDLPSVLERILAHFATPENRGRLLEAIQSEFRYWADDSSETWL
ncbi:hypothetical protein AAE478_010487 [Parahypoxylon ruwenzoriense]